MKLRKVTTRAPWCPAMAVLSTLMIVSACAEVSSPEALPEIGTIHSEMFGSTVVNVTPINQRNQVAVYHRTDATHWHDRPGTGTILNANWVLTAAHVTRYSVYHNGPFASPSETFVSTSLSPGLVSTTGGVPVGSFVPTEIVRHPVLDVALMRVAIPGFGAVSLSRDSVGSLLGKDLKCYGYGRAVCPLNDTITSTGAGTLRSDVFDVVSVYPSVSEYWISSATAKISNGDSGGACFLDDAGGSGAFSLVGIHLSGMQDCSSVRDLSVRAFSDWARHTMFGSAFLPAVVSPIL